MNIVYLKHLLILCALCCTVFSYGQLFYISPYGQKCIQSSNIYQFSCKQDAMANFHAYIGGWGMAEKQVNQENALSMAKQEASHDFTSNLFAYNRWVLRNYVKYANESEYTLQQMNELCSATSLTFQRISLVCKYILQDSLGLYTAYVAVRLPIDSIKQVIINQLDDSHIEYDKQRFTDYLFKNQ